MKQYVLDSYAMIAYFEDEPGADRVAKILRQLIQGKAKGYMSVVNWGEVYYNTMREGGSAEAEKVILQLDKFPIQVVEVNRELAYEAAKLKGMYRIAYADCFAAALSVKLNALLVTGDPEFKKLKEQVSIQWIV
ncbi:MAG: type II toxin-antitoxin system VapC family toxin [Deltaproteobacteria bacterium]|nr:type II toxin-antitoxin system VapC family toxin [Deltaproteobacteria bacterium]